MLAVNALAGAQADWEKIHALDAGPQQKATSQAEALQVTTRFLAMQEDAYRNFLARYPDDPHAVDVKLRLAHLLSVKADLQGNPALNDDADQLLEKLARDPALPPARRVDVEFARLSLFMRGVKVGSSKDRADLLLKVRDFQEKFPTDRRVAPTLAETATLFDDDPAQKQTLLTEAQALTKDDALRRQINDDLHRISLLGKPLNLKLPAIDGRVIDTAALTGKVVVICFFATWSPPSMDAVQALPTWSPGEVQVVGISLDRDPAAAAAALKEAKLSWPVFCDGKGWTGATVRSLGLNALPTIWVLDRAGRLRTLNAAPAAIDDLVRQLLREQ
jgi:peroxiredoxin